MAQFGILIVAIDLLKGKNLVKLLVLQTPQVTQVNVTRYHLPSSLSVAGICILILFLIAIHSCSFILTFWTCLLCVYHIWQREPRKHQDSNCISSPFSPNPKSFFAAGQNKEMKMWKAQVTNQALNEKSERGESLVARSGWNDASHPGVLTQGVAEELKEHLAPRDESGDLETLISLAIWPDNWVREKHQQRDSKCPVKSSGESALAEWSSNWTINSGPCSTSGGCCQRIYAAGMNPTLPCGAEALAGDKGPPVLRTS